MKYVYEPETYYTHVTRVHDVRAGRETREVIFKWKTGRLVVLSGGRRRRGRGRGVRQIILI